MRRAASMVPAAVISGLLAARSPTIEQVAWLQGCWVSASAQRVVEENWTAPRGRSMIGVSRTVRGDSLVEYELVVLRAQPGALVYEAHPSGQPAGAFTAATASDTAVVFENRLHDFPQRIGYRRVGADSLVAWIEGSIAGRSRRVEFAYARARCAGRGS